MRHPPVNSKPINTKGPPHTRRASKNSDKIRAALSRTFLGALDMSQAKGHVCKMGNKSNHGSHGNKPLYRPSTSLPGAVGRGFGKKTFFNYRLSPPATPPTR